MEVKTFEGPIYKPCGNKVKKYWIIGISNIDFKKAKYEFLVIVDSEDSEDTEVCPEVVTDKELLCNFYDTEDEARLNLLPF